MAVSSQAHDARRRYRLDNAANVYPAIKNRKRPGMFRVSATLRQQVEPDLLQEALDATLKRIPSFAVRMRSGLFWHYFSHSEDQIHIQEDVINPCMRLSPQKDNGFQIRVRHHDRRIALEIFHSVSDGSGALVFLKTLVGQYLRLDGTDIPATHGVLDCGQPPRPAEAADDFRAFAGQSPPTRRRKRHAYHVSGTKLPHHDINIITGTVPVGAVRAESKRHGVSITEYLTSVYLTVFNDIQKTESRHSRRPVRVQVPVDLRRFYPSETLRNFASYVGPTIDPTHGDYTFEEILSSVHHYMRYEITAKHLRSRVATNIRTERNLLIRMLPLFVKNRAISVGYQLSGPAIYTSVLSNLGVIEIPPEMAAHVEMFDFLLGPSRVANVDCAILGYDNQLRINFTRVIEEPAVERGFFTFLIKQGIPVKVESNKETTACPIA
ncbi:MAG: hypothetical protein JXC32_09645 [Anaerolineae bacterium]|nr:hypothetical protein [Anaerolineae bacterium]